MLLMRRTRESQRTDVHGFRDKTAHRVDFVIIGGSGGGVSAHDIGPKRGMADIDRDIGADPLLLDHRKIFGEGLEIPLNSFFQRLDGHPLDRSEEHTSELQSLMRISYAVFCLKKKRTST